MSKIDSCRNASAAIVSGARSTDDELRHRQLIIDALSPALKLASSMSDWNASRVLLSFTHALRDHRLARTTCRGIAESLIAQALDRHRLFESDDREKHLPDTGFYRDAARLYALYGRCGKAIRASLLLQSESRDGALSEIASIFAWTGDTASARRIFVYMRSRLARFDSLWQLADAYARSGRAREAFATIATIQGSALAAGHRKAALKSVAEWLAFRGDGDAAIKAALAIRSVEDRVHLLASMAEWAAAQSPLLIGAAPVRVKRRKKRTKAEVYLTTALSASRSLKAHARTRALLSVGLAYAVIGDTDAARDLLAELAPRLSSADENRFKYRIASSEVLGGRLAAARRLTRSLSGRCRAAALREIALAEAAAGREDEALATGRSIRIPETRIDALLGVASQAATAGRFDDARAQLRTVAQYAKPHIARLRDETTEAIACEQARIGDFRGAGRTLLANRRYPHQPSFGPAAIAFAESGRHEAALLFAGRASSADEQAELLARIRLIRHAQHCERCQSTQSDDLAKRKSKAG